MAVNLSEILQLPIEERLRLVESIWDSIAECPEAFELTDEQKRELDRRLDDLEAKPGAGMPWSELRARLLAGQ